MHPVDFKGSNITIGKPENMTDEECSDLRAYHGVDGSGFPFFLIAVQPNREDIDAIKKGRPVFIKIITRQMPPVAVFTLDDNEKVNEL